jgi:hypothetical protein
MLFGPGLPLASEVTLSTASGAQGTYDAALKLGSSTSTIRLPALVRSGQSITLTPSAGTHIHLEGKLAALPPTSAPPMLGTRYPLSAADLRQLEPTGICCAACDRIVASLSPAQSQTHWKDLPSEHWAEMIEIWMCHQDPTWTSKLARHTEQGFWPDKGGLLVGGSYLLVHKEDARRVNMTYTKGKVSILSVLNPSASCHPHPQHFWTIRRLSISPTIVSSLPIACSRKIRDVESRMQDMPRVIEYGSAGLVIRVHLVKSGCREGSGEWPVCQRQTGLESIHRSNINTLYPDVARLENDERPCPGRGLGSNRVSPSCARGGYSPTYIFVPTLCYICR